MMSVRLTITVGKLWERVHVLARILGVRDAETKIKVKALEQFVVEEMSFYHAELVNNGVTDRERHPIWGDKGQLVQPRL